MGIFLLYSQADWAASLDQDREHSRVLTVYANQTNIEALALLLFHLQFSKHASVSFSVADPSSAPSARLDIVLLFTTALSSSQQLAMTSPPPFLFRERMFACADLHNKALFGGVQTDVLLSSLLLFYMRWVGHCARLSQERLYRERLCAEPYPARSHIPLPRSSNDSNSRRSSSP
jgi:hypothetical protein